MTKFSRLDKRKLEKIIKTQPARSARWLKGVGEQIVGDVKMSMADSPRTGERYSRGQGRTHIASSPGEPPRPDTGTLINSIRLRKVGELHYEVVDGVEYGIYLEEGTTRIAPRPFMRPAFEAWRDQIVQDAKDNLLI